MATNPAVSLPDASRVREALDRLPVRGGLRLRGRAPTPRPSPTSKLPALAWGEKDGTVTNSERRISPPAAPVRRARRGARRLADRRRRGHGHGLRRRLRLALAGPGVPRMGAPDGLREHRPRCLNLGPLVGPDAGRLRRAGAGPVAGDGGRAGRRGCSPTAASRPRTAGRAWSRSPPKGPADAVDARLSAVAQHRPRPRPLAHHDPHGPGPRAVPPRARAARRDPPRRRRGAGRGRRRPDPRDDRARRGRGAGPRHRPPAARRPVHAHALDRRLRAVGPRQPAGRAEPSIRARASRSSSTPRPRARLSRDLARLLPRARRPGQPPPGLDLVWRRIPRTACQLHEFAGRGDEARARRLAQGA